MRYALILDDIPMNWCAGLGCPKCRQPALNSCLCQPCRAFDYCVTSCMWVRFRSARTHHRPEMGGMVQRSDFTERLRVGDRLPVSRFLLFVEPSVSEWMERTARELL